MRVLTIRVSAATSWLLTPRMSMALMGVSRACSPRRRTFASSREDAMAAARLHQVRPIQVDSSVATRMPDRTAPTRTAPILMVEKADAWTTSSAVRGPVRSWVPPVTTWERTYAVTAAVVSRDTVTSVGRRRPGTSCQRGGWLGHAHASRRTHTVGPTLFSADISRPRVGCGLGVLPSGLGNPPRHPHRTRPGGEAPRCDARDGGPVGCRFRADASMAMAVAVAVVVAGRWWSVWAV